MKRMVWVAILAGAVFTNGPARAMSIGANGGVSVLTPTENGDNLTTIAMPGGGGFFGLGFQPGLRLGSSSESGNDFYADLGIASAFASGSDITSFQGTANFQHTFSPTGTSPFVTVGVGGMFLGGDFESTNAVLGGGLGVCGRVSDGHGILRAEVRVDYIAEDTDGFIGGVAVGFKLGFDLIVK